MTVYLVGAGPGDPGLLTQRGATLLSEADVVIHDRLVHHSILDLAPNSAEMIDVGKWPGDPGGGTARQSEINRLLVARGQAGSIVVRLKGGDPYLFGRGGEEAEVLSRAGVPWEVVPGVSSALGVPAAVGIPVTHRGLSSSVTVVTGSVGDPNGAGGVDWDLLAKIEGTLVILMGMTNRAQIADALQRGGKAAATPTAVIEQGTTSAQAVVRTTLGELASVSLGSPSVIVVGPVASLGSGTHLVPGASEGKLVSEAGPVVGATRLDGEGPLSGRTVVVTRSGPRARGLVEAVQRAGAETIELPLTEQTGPGDEGVALRAAAKDVQRYRWVVFTSVNAVDRFIRELRDARALGTVLVAAVGPASADALRRAGVEPDLVPGEWRAAGVVAEFPKHDPAVPNNRVLFPCGDKAPPTIPDGLKGKGWGVERVEAYKTVNMPPPAATLLDKIAHADAVIVTAASSVQAFAALAGANQEMPPTPLVVCIGPTTAESARTLGLSRVVEAHDPTTQGIIEALIEHLAGPGAAGS
jgi:uroporphyrinogen III methyltransferase/synthase